MIYPGIKGADIGLATELEHSPEATRGAVERYHEIENSTRWESRRLGFRPTSGGTTPRSRANRCQ